MDFGMKGRVAIVMASSDGLGLACAEALAREGAQLVVCSRDTTRIQEAELRLEHIGGAKVVAIAADIHTADGRRRVVDAAVSGFGGLDMLIVNTPGGAPGSNFSGFGLLMDYEPAEWMAAFDAKFFTALEFTRLAVPLMRARKWGRIVNLSTITALEPLPQFGLSNSTRAAALGLFRTLALEVGGDGITVNSVLVGHTETKTLKKYFSQLAAIRGSDDESIEEEHIAQTSIRRLIRPEEIGALVCFLCSEAAGAMTGQAVRMDGGYSKAL